MRTLSTILFICAVINVSRTAPASPSEQPDTPETQEAVVSGSTTVGISNSSLNQVNDQKGHFIELSTETENNPDSNLSSDVYITEDEDGSTDYTPQFSLSTLSASRNSNTTEEEARIALNNGTRAQLLINDTASSSSVTDTTPTYSVLETDINSGAFPIVKTATVEAASSTDRLDSSSTYAESSALHQYAPSNFNANGSYGTSPDDYDVSENNIDLLNTPATEYTETTTVTGLRSSRPWPNAEALLPVGYSDTTLDSVQAVQQDKAPSVSLVEELPVEPQSTSFLGVLTSTNQEGFHDMKSEALNSEQTQTTSALSNLASSYESAHTTANGIASDKPILVARSVRILVRHPKSSGLDSSLMPVHTSVDLASSESFDVPNADNTSSSHAMNSSTQSVVSIVIVCDSAVVHPTSRTADSFEQTVVSDPASVCSVSRSSEFPHILSDTLSSQIVASHFPSENSGGRWTLATKQNTFETSPGDRTNYVHTGSYIPQELQDKSGNPDQKEKEASKHYEGGYGNGNGTKASHGTSEPIYPDRNEYAHLIGSSEDDDDSDGEGQNGKTVSNGEINTTPIARAEIATEREDADEED